jgi:hypothetical protein
VAYRVHKEKEMPEMEKVEFTFPDEQDEKEQKTTETNETVADTKETEETEDTSSELEVEIVDDTPPKDRNRKPSEPPAEVTEEELGEYSEKVRKRIQHFSKGYHDERRAKEQALREREELERLAAQLVEENKKLKGTVNKNQEALLEQAKKSVATELEQAKAKFKQAYDSGDSDAVVAAQEELTNAKIKADRVANFKLPSLQEESSSVQTQQTAPTVKTDPRATEWAKANPWFGPDEEMTSYVLGLHQKLVKQGVNPRSDEYYETIDSRMRELFPDRFSDVEDEPAVKPRPKKASVVAPATRSTAPKKIVLTSTQVAYAKKFRIPLEEYARQVAEQIKREQQNG